MSDSNQQKLKSEVQELQSSIESKDMELLVSKQTATEAQNARYIARGRLEKVGEQAVETQTKVTQLLKKSSDTWDQLELKQKTLKVFQKLPESEKAELQGVIDHTNQEIQKLQEELEIIQAELESEKKKACSLPDQLSQANKELAEKSARVQELEWVRQELDTLLELKRKRVDQLLMQVAAASNLQQYNMKMKVIKILTFGISDVNLYIYIFIQHQLVTIKMELEAKIAEVANLKQTVAYQDAEVQRLSAKLRSKEALLHVQILLMQLSQATKPDHTQELKSMGELQRLTEKVSELRVKLLYAEDAKQEAQRQMEAAELKSRLLQEIVREYRQNPPPVPPRQLQRLAPKLQESRNPPPPVPPKQLQRQAPKLQESKQAPPPVPPRQLQESRLAPELQESRNNPPPVPPKRLQNLEPELQESRQTSLSVTPKQSRKPVSKSIA